MPTPERPVPARRRLSPFGALVTATAVSSVGDGLLLVAAPLLAASMTDRPGLVAGAAVAARLPWLLAPLTGVITDRVHRARVFAAVETGRAAILLAFGALVVADVAALWHLYAAVFLLALGDTVFSSATLGAVPAIVDDADLPRANGRLFVAQVAGEQFVGPALGGVVFAAGAGVAFVADGLSFALSGLLLVLAFPLHRVGPARPPAPVRGGIDHVRRSPTLRRLTVTIAAFSFCQAMVLATLVLFATRTLGLSTSGFGLFLAAGAVGNLIGGAAAPRVARRHDAGTVLAGAGIGAAGAYLVAGATSSIVVATAAFVFEAVCVAVAMVTTVTLRQRLIPAELYGRVGNLVRSAAYVAMAVGAAVGGLVVEHHGLRMPFAVAGVLQLAFVVVAVLPRRRRFEERPAPPERPTPPPIVLTEEAESGELVSSAG